MAKNKTTQRQLSATEIAEAIRELFPEASAVSFTVNAKTFSVNATHGITVMEHSSVEVPITLG